MGKKLKLYLVGWQLLRDTMSNTMITQYNGEKLKDAHCMFLYYLQLRPKIVSLSQVVAKKFKSLALAGLVLVVIQIALGGWTASNYAATICTELPVCNSGWTKKLLKMSIGESPNAP